MSNFVQIAGNFALVHLSVRLSRSQINDPRLLLPIM